MNRQLNNWLDQVEGLPENTTNDNLIKELIRQGYETNLHRDDKTKKFFVGWSKIKKPKK